MATGLCRGMRAAVVCTVGLVALTGCRVDIAVNVDVRNDGSGQVTVSATADADVMRAAPELAEQLVFEDAVAAGWSVDDPVDVDGGLRVTLHRSFSTPEQASAVLATINGPGGPLQGVVMSTTTDGAIAVNGVLRVDGGLTAFTDPALLDLIGGTAPYADEIAATGITPSQAIGIDVSIDIGAGPRTFTVPLDGTSQTIELVGTGRPADSPSGVWRMVSTASAVALIGWTVSATAFIAWVAHARRQRQRRRQHRQLTHPPLVDRQP